MKVLVIGSGGREHALAWKLRQSPRVSQVYCAPGNGGISDEAQCLPADVKSLDSLMTVANQVRPDLTIVGPELPLALGVVDEFNRPRAVLGLPQLPVCVGIATGVMFIGNVGTYQKMDFTAVGNAANGQAATRPINVVSPPP